MGTVQAFLNWILYGALTVCVGWDGQGLDWINITHFLQNAFEEEHPVM